MFGDSLPIIPWLFLHATVLSCIFVIDRLLMAKMRQKAKIEFELRTAAERAAKEKMEHELTLARKIQDSLAPPPSRLYLSDWKVCFFQKRHDKVGGDWMAVRQDSENSLIIVIADAAGKGIQAALVIHAVQSLWADALYESKFDPAKWMQRVNRSLFQLGKSEKHSISMGLVVLRSSILTYWNAGHLPLFVVKNSETSSETKVLSGRGSLLGFVEDISISPTTFHLPEEPLHIVLASDGILNKGTRTRSEDIEGLITKLTNKGVAALDDLGTDDDRTVIWLTKTATRQILKEIA